MLKGAALDLGDLAQVRAFAEEVNKAGLPVNALVNNGAAAGVHVHMRWHRACPPDGKAQDGALARAEMRSVEARQQPADETEPARFFRAAGIMAAPEGRTADGLESQFGVNHMAGRRRSQPACARLDNARLLLSSQPRCAHAGPPESPLGVALSCRATLPSQWACCLCSARARPAS